MLTKPHFDDLEIRSADQRAADLAEGLPRQIARAQALSGSGDTLTGVDAAQVTSAAALAGLSAGWAAGGRRLAARRAEETMMQST